MGSDNFAVVVRVPQVVVQVRIVKHFPKPRAASSETSAVTGAPLMAIISRPRR